MANNELTLELGIDIKKIATAMQSVEKLVKDFPKTFKESTQENQRQINELAKSVSKDLGQAFKDSSTIANKSLDEIVSNIKNIGKATEEEAGKTEKNWANAFSRIGVIAGSLKGAGELFGGLLQPSIEMEKSMNQLSFVSQEVKENYDEVRNSISKMGKELPIKSTGELVNAMKDLAADGYNVANSLKLTEEAARAAVAGNTSVETSIGALKNVLGAYNLNITESTRVQDLLFKSSQMTGEAYGNLATNIAAAVPGVATMGVSFDNFLGSVTALSKMNVPVQESIGLMDMAAKQLNRTMGQAYMESHSLTEGLIDIYQQAGGEFDKIIEMVGKPELARAVIMLGQNAQSVKADFEELGNATGTMQAAFDLNANSMESMVELLKKGINSIRDSLVTNLFPIFKIILQGIIGIVEHINKFPTPLKMIISAFVLWKTASVALNVSGLMPILKNMGTFAKEAIPKAIKSLLSFIGITNASRLAFIAFTTTVTLGLGALLVFLPDIIDFVEGLFKIGDTAEGLKNVKEETNQLNDSYKDFQSNTVPIVKEYIELQDKLARGENLTTEETEKLQKATRALAEKYPELIDQSKSVNGNLVLQADAMKLLDTETQKYVAGLDNVIAKNRQIIKDIESGGGWWEKAKNGVSRGLYSMVGMGAEWDAEKMLEDSKKQSEAYSNIFEAALQKARTSKTQINNAIEFITNAGLANAGQKLINDWTNQIALYNNSLKDTKPATPQFTNPEEFQKQLETLKSQYTNTIDKVKGYKKDLNEAFNSNNKEDIKALSSHYSDQVKTQVQELDKTRKDAITFLLAAGKNLSDKEVNNIKKFFHIDLNSKDQKTTTKTAEVNIANIYKNLYESHVVKGADYKKKVEELLSDIENNSKFKSLQTKFDTGTINKTELKEYNEYITNRKNLTKEIQDLNKKEYADVLSAKKEFLELTKIQFDSHEIGTSGYIEALKKSSLEFEELILNCGDKAADALEQFKLGKLTEQQIKNVSDSLKETAPELEESFNTAIKAITDNDKIIKEIEKNQLKETLEKKLKAAENVVKDFGKIGISFKDSYSIINDAIAEVENQLANTLENDIETRAKYNEQIEKLNEQKREIEAQDITKTVFWAAQITNTLQQFSVGIGDALAMGFGKEGFQKLADTMKQGFKSLLVAFIDGLEKLMIGADIYTLIASMIPGMQVEAIKNAGLKIAAMIGLTALKGAVMAMATGGMVTKPTLVMAGEAGAEMYAPKKDFLTIARELIAQERQNMPNINSRQQSINVRLQMDPVEMIQKGSQLSGVIKLHEKIQNTLTY
jgi:hypothetical protein